MMADLPPHARLAVQRILDREAARLLVEHVDTTVYFDDESGELYAPVTMPEVQDPEADEDST